MTPPLPLPPGHCGDPFCVHGGGGRLVRVDAELPAEEGALWGHQLLLPRHEGHVLGAQALRVTSRPSAPPLQGTRYANTIGKWSWSSLFVCLFVCLFLFVVVKVGNFHYIVG